MAYNMRSMSSALPRTAVRSVCARSPLLSHVGTMTCNRPAPAVHGLFISNGVSVTAMRHGCKMAKLNLPADQRKALIRSLTTEVLLHGKITTTKVRAMAIRKYVDKMITLAKDGSLHARRQALSFIMIKGVVETMFIKAPERYAERNGGYCRVIPIQRRRRGDQAELAVIELMGPLVAKEAPAAPAAAVEA